MPEKCLIIGLGHIGMGYDLEHDPAKAVYSHARHSHFIRHLNLWVQFDFGNAESAFWSHTAGHLFDIGNRESKNSKCCRDIAPTVEHVGR